MSKIIFRKIAGKIVPIKIGSQAAITGNTATAARKITAHAIQGKEKVMVGNMNLTIPKKGASATVDSVNVEKKFQKHGLSRAMFKHAQEFLGRIGKKFMRSYELQHVAQVKIRTAAGKGPRGKAGTKFIGSGYGPYGEMSKKIRSGEAKRLIKNPGINGQSVSATTMIPKKYRKK